MNLQTSLIPLSFGKIRLAEKGVGFPVIMLHSNGATLESWILNIKELSEKFRVIVPDLPGFGESYKPKNNLTIDMLTDCIIEIMEKLEIEKAHIIGNSLGGVLALDIASKYPQKTEKLVLVGTPSGEKKETNNIIKLLNSWIDNNGIPSLNEKQAKAITPNVTPEIVKIINQNLKQAERCFAKVNALLNNYNYNETMAKVQNKTIIISGEEDGITKKEFAPILSKKLNNAPVYILEKSGHSPQFDNPECFNKIVLDFFS